VLTSLHLTSLTACTPNKSEDAGVDGLPGSPTVSCGLDKTVYTASEPILITVHNTSNAPILSHVGSGTPVFAIEHIQQRTAEGNWEDLYAQCQPPHCLQDIDAPARIESGASASFTWEPLIFVDGTEESAPVDPGTYRVVILYEDIDATAWVRIYTESFTIR
jgi:hypothetical protein